MSDILLSACVVTHRPIGRMMDSIAGLIDEALIWCTTEEAKSAVCRNIKENGWDFPVKYPYVPWSNDFSTPRNEEIEKARGEWILYIDSDEWVVHEVVGAVKKIRHILETTEEDAFFIPFWNWTDEAKTKHSLSRLIRIFRRSKAHFEGEVDNALVGFTKASIMVGIHMEHDGYDSPAKLLKKAEERKGIYDVVLAKNPDSWKDWYHYSKNRFMAQDLPGCIKACERAIDLLLRYGLLGEHTGYVDIYRVLARARLALSDFNGAERALLGGHGNQHGALTVAPRYSDAYYELYLVHGMLADQYERCWKAELEFRKQTGNIPPYDLVYLNEEVPCES